MHISIRIASFTLAALVLGTSMASAGVWDTIMGQDDSYTPPVIHVTPHMPFNEGVSDSVADQLHPKLPYIKLIDVPGQDALADGVLALDCQIADAGDLLLINSGNIDLPAGAKVKWEVRSADLKGFVTFKAGFAAGANFTLSDAAEGLDGAAPCAAKPIGL